MRIFHLIKATRIGVVNTASTENAEMIQRYPFFKTTLAPGVHIYVILV